jgi:hypothetical protein
MKFILVFLLLCTQAFANADLYELEGIIQSEFSGRKSFGSVPDVEGSTSLSKDQSLSEMLISLDKCKFNDSIKTHTEEYDDHKVFSVSCRTDEKTILVSESLINRAENKSASVVSFQEMTFEEKTIYPKEYYKLLSEYDYEKVSTNKEATPGLRTLGTFAHVGLPVVLAFRTSRILAPDRLDWQKHFIAGSIISGVTILTAQGILRFIARRRGVHMSETKIRIISSIAGLMMGLVVGGGKEVYDRVSGRGTPEFKDAMFTAAGGAFVSMFFAIPFGRLFGFTPISFSPAPASVLVLRPSPL